MGGDMRSHFRNCDRCREDEDMLAGSSEARGRS